MTRLISLPSRSSSRWVQQLYSYIKIKGVTRSQLITSKGDLGGRQCCGFWILCTLCKQDHPSVTVAVPCGINHPSDVTPFHSMLVFSLEGLLLSAAFDDRYDHGAESFLSWRRLQYCVAACVHECHPVCAGASEGLAASFRNTDAIM